MANCDRCSEIGFCYAFCLACTKEFSGQKFGDYLFHKIGVTAPQTRLRSVWDQSLRSAAEHSLVLERTSMTVNMKALIT